MNSVLCRVLVLLAILPLSLLNDQNDSLVQPQSHWEWQWHAKQVPPAQIQCPCILKPGTNECLQYDAMYQATSIDEAISSFVDMTLEESESYGFLKQACPSCARNCEQRLRERLRVIGFLPDSSVQPTMDWTSIRGECEKYRFSRPGDKAVRDYGQQFRTKRNAGSQQYSFPSPNKIRRQTSNDAFGQRFNISCVQKGITPDADGLFSLCSKCWAWRKLPHGYVPGLINECVCDDHDSTCLGSYGKCSSGYRTVEVVRTDLGKPVTLTIQARTFCECKVPAGSALENLISG